MWWIYCPRQVPTGAYGPLKNCSWLGRRLERAGGGSVVVPTGGTMSGKVLALFDVDGTLTKPRNVRHAHQHARQRTLATGRGRSRSRQPSALVLLLLLLLLLLPLRAVMMSPGQHSTARHGGCSAAEGCACPRRRSRRR